MKKIEEEARYILNKQFQLISTKPENLMNKENIKSFIQESIKSVQGILKQLEETKDKRDEKEMKRIEERCQKLRYQEQVFLKAYEMFDEEYIKFLEEYEARKINNALIDSYTLKTAEDVVKRNMTNTIQSKSALDSSNKLNRLIKKVRESMNTRYFVKKLKKGPKELEALTMTRGNLEINKSKLSEVVRKIHKDMDRYVIVKKEEKDKTINLDMVFNKDTQDDLEI